MPKAKSSVRQRSPGILQNAGRRKNWRRESESERSRSASRFSRRCFSISRRGISPGRMWRRLRFPRSGQRHFYDFSGTLTSASMSSSATSWARALPRRCGGGVQKHLPSGPQRDYFPFGSWNAAKTRRDRHPRPAKIVRQLISLESFVTVSHVRFDLDRRQVEPSIAGTCR